MELVDNFVQSCISIMSNFGIFAGIFLILLESIIPALPLSVFITLNSMTYGRVVGILISWLSTVLGCSMSFWLFRTCFQNKWNKFIKGKNIEQLEDLTKKVSNITLSNLTLLVTVPFTPAFLINIACGLSKIKYKKFLIALLISKLMLVIFWSYIGTTLLESLTNIEALIKIIILLVVAYIVSKILEKKLNMK